MARRVRIGLPSIFAVEEDTRPSGEVLFADPSMAEFPRHVRTFNEPHSPRSTGEQSGIRTLSGGNCVPYGDRYWNETDPWAAMNKKRGTVEEESD